ncbi:uncharacterized protein TM35_000172150 [Trypanosoma theileri]|uniref:Uncharacterized protein n=1 Tax=Trypanosoma theileri TaxID=67003 RepID=A0A1X0NV25_9TRYP|nr:uncharacterized protein TM35_000172150 [Trypanosoma theileri]ORC88343.1 hypothetical protein TM35_000172150 [Trypanosoma theileri]
MPRGGRGGESGGDNDEARRVFMEVEIEGGENHRYFKVEPRARFKNVTRAIGKKGVLVWNGCPLPPQETPLSYGMPRGLENAIRLVFEVRDRPPFRPERASDRDWLEALAIHRRRMEGLRLSRARFLREGSGALGPI